MHIPSYTAVDAAVALSEKATDEHCDASDMRATVIDLLSNTIHKQKAPTKHETDQIFILGYN